MTNEQLQAQVWMLRKSVNGMKTVIEIAARGKNDTQHVYLESRLGNFVKITECLIAAEETLAATDPANQPEERGGLSDIENPTQNAFPDQPKAEKCVVCGGNDQDAPCAYPGEGFNKCLRDIRLLKIRQPETEKVDAREAFERYAKLATLQQPVRTPLAPMPEDDGSDDALDARRYRFLKSEMRVGSVQTQLPLYRTLHWIGYEECGGVQDADTAIDAAMLAKEGQ